MRKSAGDSAYLHIRYKHAGKEHVDVIPRALQKGKTGTHACYYQVGNKFVEYHSQAKYKVTKAQGGTLVIEYADNCDYLTGTLTLKFSDKNRRHIKEVCWGANESIWKGASLSWGGTIPLFSWKVDPPSPKKRRSGKGSQRKSPANLIKRGRKWVDIHKENTELGSHGEAWVSKRENERLKEMGLHPKHKASAKNDDSLGYDIESWDRDESGKIHKIFIEVKTTKGVKNSPFFISANEMSKAKNSKHWRLHRVFDFNIKTKQGPFYVKNGFEIDGLRRTCCSYSIYPNEEG